MVSVRIWNCRPIWKGLSQRCQKPIIFICLGGWMGKYWGQSRYRHKPFPSLTILNQNITENLFLSIGPTPIDNAIVYAFTSLRWQKRYHKIIPSWDRSFEMNILETRRYIHIHLTPKQTNCHIIPNRQGKSVLEFFTSRIFPSREKSSRIYLQKLPIEEKMGGCIWGWMYFIILLAAYVQCVYTLHMYLNHQLSAISA